jgi:uncharacterized protein (DUF2236 family)
LRPTLAIVFGRPEQVREAAAAVNRVHARVVGPGYSALEPALLAWVLATLIDTTLMMHERFVRPLDPVMAEAYYQDMKLAGGLLAMPVDALPADLAGFRAYVEGMLATLEVSATGRELAAALFPTTSASAPLMLLLRELSAGLLPPRLRGQFGLGWGIGREGGLEAVAGLSRRFWPLLPARLRLPPPVLLPR